jgi:hypothetical protein
VNKKRGRVFLGLLILAGTAWLTVNGSFSFQGTFDCLADRAEYPALEKRIDRLPSPAATAIRWGAEHVPLLLPESYVHTLLTQAGIAGKGKRMFFNGAYNEKGWWWLMTVAFLIKMPLAFLLLLLLGFARWRCAYPLWIYGGFALFLLLFFTFMSRVSYGVRYLYPALPGLAVVCGLGLARMMERNWKLKVLGGGLLLWLASAALLTHPHQLSYANEAVGGSENLYKIMGDSNVDWGQDLPALARLIREKKLKPLLLSYFGSDDPAAYGIDYEPMPSIGLRPAPGEPWWFEAGYEEHIQGSPGWYAVSANNLNGLFFRDPDLFSFLRTRKPDYRAGYSILVYDLRTGGMNPFPTQEP